MKYLLILSVLFLGACSADGLGVSTARSDDEGAWDPSSDNDAGASEQFCGGVVCPSGYHCEYDSCVSNSPPPSAPELESRELSSSSRYVFILESEQRRVVRIDSLTLEVDAFVTGLAPMDLAVVESRDQMLLLDAYDLVEILDHSEETLISGAWDTARSLSHVVASPGGLHAVAYYDWDDERSAERQPEPGNINQISVIALEEGSMPLNDSQERVRNIAVGFLPREVRYSNDGLRALVIARDSLTPINLLAMNDGIAEPMPPIQFEQSAREILVDGDVSQAILRYPLSTQVDILSLNGDETRCFTTAAPVADMVWTASDEIAILTTSETASNVVKVNLADAGPVETCTVLAAGTEFSISNQLVLDFSSGLLVAWDPILESEKVTLIDLDADEIREIRLEKAVVAISFAGDGQYAILSHLKAPGTPLWDPWQEDPEESVDKSYGVTWLNMATGEHRLAVSSEPYGEFAIVPATADAPGATFQAIVDEQKPQIIRVEHGPGFDDVFIDLAAPPARMGYLSATEKVFVTQDHLWGRVTFIDQLGEELRHVTGFILGAL